MHVAVIAIRDFADLNGAAGAGDGNKRLGPEAADELALGLTGGLTERMQAGEAGRAGPARRGARGACRTDAAAAPAGPGGPAMPAGPGRPLSPCGPGGPFSPAARLRRRLLAPRVAQRLLAIPEVLRSIRQVKWPRSVQLQQQMRASNSPLSPTTIRAFHAYCVGVNRTPPPYALLFVILRQEF